MKYKLMLGMDHYCGSYTFQGDKYATWNRYGKPKLWSRRKAAEDAIKNQIWTLIGDHEDRMDEIRIVEVTE